MTSHDNPCSAEAGALHHFRRLAERAPDHPFLQIDGELLSRQEFLARAAAWGAAFAHRGVGAGDYVALIAPNGLTWYAAFWAAVAVGARPVPLDPQIGAWELEQLLGLLELKVVVSVTRFRTAELAANLVQASARCQRRPLLVCLDGPRPGMLTEEEFLSVPGEASTELPLVTADTPLMLACTSGTTGNPKIIEVPHLGFVRSQLDMARVLSISPTDRMLLTMPLYHQGGFGMGLQTLLAGGEAIYLSQFDPQRQLETIERSRVTIVQLSSTLAKILLSHPQFDRFDLSSLRLAYFAGEVLPDDVARQFWEKRRIRVVNVIGSSETATMVMWDSDRDSQRSPSEYYPLPFTQIHVGQWSREESNTDDSGNEPGTLWVATDALLTRYYANPQETERRLVERAQTRWFDTQDLVQALPDGYVRFVGRVKRALKRGPNLVHPEEIEAFLLCHDQIAAAAVGRDEHELFGDAIVAWVQPTEGASLTRGDLLNYCRGKIAAYKIPDRFVLVSQLPIGLGKVQHRLIRAIEP